MIGIHNLMDCLADNDVIIFRQICKRSSDTPVRTGESAAHYHLGLRLAL